MVAPIIYKFFSTFSYAIVSNSSLLSNDVEATFTSFMNESNSSWDKIFILINKVR